MHQPFMHFLQYGACNDLAAVAVPNSIDVVLRLVRDRDGWLDRNVVGVLFLPCSQVAGRKRTMIVDSNSQEHRRCRPDVIAHPGIRLLVTSQDEHDSPVGPLENACKRFFVDPAWQRAVARVRVYPDASKSLWAKAAVDLLVKEIRHGTVVKDNGDGRARLTHELDVFDVGQVIRSRDTESTDLALISLTQIKQLRPGGRAEP